MSTWQVLGGRSGACSLSVPYPLSLCSSCCLAVICTVVVAAFSGHMQWISLTPKATFSVKRAISTCGALGGNRSLSSVDKGNRFDPLHLYVNVSPVSWLRYLNRGSLVDLANSSFPWVFSGPKDRRERISMKAWQAKSRRSGSVHALFSNGCFRGSLECAHSWLCPRDFWRTALLMDSFSGVLNEDKCRQYRITGLVLLWTTEVIITKSYL